MKNLPIITREVLEWLEAVCSVPVKASDSDNVIRWRTAQRDIYLQAEALYYQQQGTDKAKEHGFKVKSDQ